MNATALVATVGDVVERYAYDTYGQVLVLDADGASDVGQHRAYPRGPW